MTAHQTVTLVLTELIVKFVKMVILYYMTQLHNYLFAFLALLFAEHVSTTVHIIWHNVHPAYLASMNLTTLLLLFVVNFAEMRSPQRILAIISSQLNMMDVTMIVKWKIILHVKWSQIGLFAHTMVWWRLPLLNSGDQELKTSLVLL